MTEQQVSIAQVGLTEVEGEPRCLDLDLAERLGFERPRNIRKLIERHRHELEAFGVCSTVEQTYIEGGKGGRPATEYWLNEEQALLISVVSDAPKAPAVRSMLIKVFMAWRRGLLTAGPAVTLEMVSEMIVSAIAQYAAMSDAAISKRVDAELLRSQFSVTRDHKTAGEVANLAGIPSKGRRGLIRVISSGLRRHCARTGVAPREGVLGSNSAFMFPLPACHDWLDHGGGRDKIREYLDRKSGQGVLKLVQPPPKS